MVVVLVDWSSYCHAFLNQMCHLELHWCPRTWHCRYHILIVFERPCHLLEVWPGAVWWCHDEYEYEILSFIAATYGLMDWVQVDIMGLQEWWPCAQVNLWPCEHLAIWLLAIWLLTIWPLDHVAMLSFKQLAMQTCDHDAMCPCVHYQAIPDDE